MKRVICLFILITSILLLAFTQENIKKDSSYDSFVSQNGQMMKLQDFRLPWMEGIGYSSYQNRIRLVCIDQAEKYYLQIIKDSKTGNIIGSLEYNEIVEMNDAIKILQTQYDNDIARSIEYLENVFINNNGIQVGYIISDLNKGWFIRLDKYKNDSIILFEESLDIIKGLKEALNKIEEIKK